MRLDLLTGSLTGPHLDTGRTNDRATFVAALPLPPGSVLLTDLGFCSTADLATLAAQQVGWLSRAHPGAALFTADGRR